MGKALSDMTLEELWKLFPIILTEHQEIWDKWYAEEQKRLANIFAAGEYKNQSYWKYCN